jgi:hypothetical protein
VNPPSAAASKLTTVLSREEKDQELVHKLKANGYRSLAQTLFESHTE